MESIEELLRRNAEALSRINEKIASIEQKIEAIRTPRENVVLISKDEAAQILRVSRTTVNRYTEKHWQESIHYFPQASGGTLYNRDLLLNWQLYHQCAPALHQQAIDQWVRSQGQGQGQGKKRSRASVD